MTAHLGDEALGSPALEEALEETAHQDQQDAMPGKRRGWLLVLLLAIAGVCAVGMFAGLKDEAIGALALILLLALVFLRVPLAFALLIPGLLGMWATTGTRLLEGQLGTLPYHSVASWSLSVVPLFVLMGMLLQASGLTTDIYTAARNWLGWLPGGLAVGTNVAGAGLAAVSGSTLGSTYTLSRVGIPEMLKAGYDRRIAMVSVMSASLPGQLIPPSVLLIIYAGIAQTPIGPQLLSGVVPGVMVAVVFALILVGIGVTRPTMVGRGGVGEQTLVTTRERWTSLVRIWPLPMMALVIVGGMFSGVFTATEAAAVACCIAVVFSLVKFRGRVGRVMADAVVGTLNATGMIFLILVGAGSMTMMLSLTGLADGFAEWIVGLGMGRIGLLLVMLVVYLVLGMVMDSFSMIALTVPVLAPTLGTLDISMLWFGVFAILLAEIGAITPPVGLLVYLIHSVSQEPAVGLGQKITLRDAFTSVVWLLPGAVVVLVLLIFFPEVATWLPDAMQDAPGGG